MYEYQYMNVFECICVRAIDRPTMRVKGKNQYLQSLEKRIRTQCEKLKKTKYEFNANIYCMRESAQRHR